MNMIPEDDDTGSASALSSGEQASEASTHEAAEAANGDGRGGASDEIEKEARSMGWRPESEWDGPPNKWIDAKTFVERGDQIMPILRANNKKMREELLTKDKEFITLKESLAVARKAIDALRKSHNESTKREVELAIADLKERYRQAREVGDVDVELEIRENIDTLKEKAKKIGEEAEEEAPEGKEKQVKLDPAFVQWKEENPWFENNVNKDDMERTKAIIKIAEGLREKGSPLVGRPFMDECMKILEEKEKGYSRPKSKVESGGGKGGGGGGRAFDKLPAEAKKICHEDNENFVGPGKMFKTVKEWEDHYATLYGDG